MVDPHTMTHAKTTKTLDKSASDGVCWRTESAVV
jgi:hypothetical protein